MRQMLFVVLSGSLLHSVLVRDLALWSAAVAARAVWFCRIIIIIIIILTAEAGRHIIAWYHYKLVNAVSSDNHATPWLNTMMNSIMGQHSLRTNDAARRRNHELHLISE